MTTLQPTFIINTNNLTYIYQSAYHTVVNQQDSNVYTEITYWLIDFGCSTSMSLYIEYFITDKRKSSSTVEVATEVLTKAPVQGTSKSTLKTYSMAMSSTFCYIMYYLYQV